MTKSETSKRHHSGALRFHVAIDAYEGLTGEPVAVYASGTFGRGASRRFSSVKKYFGDMDILNENPHGDDIVTFLCHLDDVVHQVNAEMRRLHLHVETRTSFHATKSLPSQVVTTHGEWRPGTSGKGLEPELLRNYLLMVIRRSSPILTGFRMGAR